MLALIISSLNVQKSTRIAALLAASFVELVLASAHATTTQGKKGSTIAPSTDSATQQSTGSTATQSTEVPLSYGRHETFDTDISGLFFSIGGGIGHTHAGYHATQDALYPLTPANVNALDIKTDAGKANGIVAGSIGYGAQINRFYVGAEVYGGYDSSKITVFDNTQSGVVFGLWNTTLKRGLYYGLSPRIGYKIAPSTLVFLGVNIEMGQWQATAIPDQSIAADLNELNGNGTTITQEMMARSLATHSANKNAVTFAPRLGVDLYLSERLFIRAEYSYLFGPTLVIDLDTAGNKSVQSDGVTNRFKATQQRFLISAGYKF